MAGHITKRGDRLLLRVYAGRDPLTNRRVWRSRTIPMVGERAAEKALAAFVTEVEGGQARTPATFGELLERWYESRSGDWSPGTAQTTRTIIDGRLAVLGELDVRDVTVERLERFYAELRRRGGRKGGPLAASTVIRVHGVIRLALGQAVRWGYLASNPADLAEPGRADPAEIVPPAAKDVARLLAAAEEESPALLTFLALDAESGARRSELAALRFSDFDDRKVRISRALTIGPDTPENRARHSGRIWPAEWSRGARPTALIEKRRPKTRGSTRTITLSPATVELVRGQRRRLDELALAGGGRYPDDGFVFPARPDGDRPLRPDVWTRRFGKLRDDLDLEGVRLHDLRHFVATTLLAAGVDLATVAGRLGHGGGGKTTLAIYGHLIAEPDELASDLMAKLIEGAGADDQDDAEVVSIDAAAGRAPLRRAGRRAEQG